MILLIKERFFFTYDFRMSSPVKALVPTAPDCVSYNHPKISTYIFAIPSVIWIFPERLKISQSRAGERGHRVRVST